MTLVIDNRPTIDGPGLHALIVGVSEYIHLPEPDPLIDPETGFGMVRLASPALSAFRLFQWLARAKDDAGLSLAAPLKTCRLLIAPSTEEKVTEPALAQGGFERPTYSAFVKAAREWRKDASDNKRNITLFFFGGHGIRTHSEDSVLTMADFGEPEMPEILHCVKVSNLQDGMAPTQSRPNIAETQFYFIDACRNMPEEMRRFAPMEAQPVWDIELNHEVDTRVRPIYFSAAPNQLAHGRRGQISNFCEGLLDGLARAAENGEEDPTRPGTERWPVTPTGLRFGIVRHLERKLGAAAPKIDLRGVSGDSPLLYLAGPPTVDIDIDVDPPDLAGQADIALLDGDTNPAFELALQRARVTPSVRAGMYRVRVRSNRLATDYVSKLKFVNQALVKPWRHTLVLSA